MKSNADEIYFIFCLFSPGIVKSREFFIQGLKHCSEDTFCHVIVIYYEIE